MRSVVVVLPASMCAMMPMLRVLLSGVCLGISQNSRTSRSLPSIVGEWSCGLGHPVRVFALLPRAPAQIRGVEQLVRQLLLHRLAIAARARIADDPPDAQRKPAIRIHLDRHLVVGTADAP